MGSKGILASTGGWIMSFAILAFIFGLTVVVLTNFTGERQKMGVDREINNLYEDIQEVCKTQKVIDEDIDVSGGRSSGSITACKNANGENRLCYNGKIYGTGTISPCDDLTVGQKCELGSDYKVKRNEQDTAVVSCS